MIVDCTTCTAGRAHCPDCVIDLFVRRPGELPLAPEPAPVRERRPRAALTAEEQRAVAVLVACGLVDPSSAEPAPGEALDGARRLAG